MNLCNLFSYGGYKCFRLARPDRWSCKLMPPPWDDKVPESFIFHNPHKGSLITFIQQLLADNETVVTAAISSMLVTDIVYPPTIERETVDISLKTMISFLTLRNKWRIPLHSKIRFAFSGRGGAKFTARATEFITALAAVDPEVKGFTEIKSDQDETDLKGKVIDSGFYLPGSAEDGLADIEGTDDDGDPVETTIRRTGHQHYAELLTLVQRGSSRPYYVRRVLTYQGEIALAASSWNQTGPWTPYEKNNSLLLALGLTL